VTLADVCAQRVLGRSGALHRESREEAATLPRAVAAQ